MNSKGRLCPAQNSTLYARLIIEKQEKIYCSIDEMEETMKALLLQGILGDQDGQDTLEWVAIAALIVLIAVAVMAIIRSKAISGADAISW